MAELLIERDGAVATATFNQPERRNPLSVPMRDELRRFLRASGRDPAVRCIVLTGAGGHFTAGGDVALFRKAIDEMQADDRLAYFQDRINGLQPFIDQIRETPKPVIAKVRGACAGVGVAMLLACDLAYAAEDAFLSTSYVRIGAAPDGGLSYLLPQLIGTRRAMELLLLGDRIDAAKAREMGLINGVFPEDALDDEVGKIARKLAAGPGLAHAAIKRLVLAAPQTTLESAMTAERREFAALTVTKDFEEGVGAFVEKRKAEFKGE